MTHVMEILDYSGHLTLSWNPDDAESVERARQEFERLKAAGYAFFVSDDEQAAKVARLKPAALAQAGSLDVRPVLQTREFQPRRRRQVAVRPLQGG